MAEQSQKSALSRTLAAPLQTHSEGPWRSRAAEAFSSALLLGERPTMRGSVAMETPAPAPGRLSMGVGEDVRTAVWKAMAPEWGIDGAAVSAHEIEGLVECVVHTLHTPLVHGALLENNQDAILAWLQVLLDAADGVLGEVPRGLLAIVSKRAKKCKKRELAIGALELRIDELVSHPAYSVLAFSTKQGREQWLQLEMARLEKHREALITASGNAKEGARIAASQKKKGSLQRWVASRLGGALVHPSLVNGHYDHHRPLRLLACLLFAQVERRAAAAAAAGAADDAAVTDLNDDGEGDLPPVVDGGGHGAAEDDAVVPFSPVAMMLLQEYVERFGINPPFLTLTISQMLVLCMDRSLGWLLHLRSALIEAQTLARANNVVLLRQERALYNNILHAVHANVKDMLVHYKRDFPQNVPEGALTEVLNIFEVLGTCPEIDWEKLDATSHEHVLWHWVQAGVEERYHMCRGTASNSNASAYSTLCDMVDMVEADLGDDTNHFQHIFPWIDAELNLVSVATKQYYLLLIADLQPLLQRVATEEEMKGELFGLADRLRRLHASLAMYVMQEEVSPLYLEFAPYLRTWMTTSATKVPEWVQQACSLDAEWAPVSERVAPISSSLVDVFVVLSQAAEMYKQYAYLDLRCRSHADMGIEPPLPQTCMALFADLVKNALATYSTIVAESMLDELALPGQSKSNGTNSKRDKKNAADSFDPRQRKLMQAVGRQSIAVHTQKEDDLRKSLRGGGSMDLSSLRHTISEAVNANNDKKNDLRATISADAGGGASLGLGARASVGGGASGGGGVPILAVPAPVCVRLNNIDTARAKLDAFCTELEDHFCAVTTYVEGVGMAPYAKEEISELFAPVFVHLKSMMTLMIDRVALWLNDAFVQALDLLIRLPSERDAAKDAAVHADQLFAPQRLVNQRLQPLVDFLDHCLAALCDILSYNGRQLVIRRLWELLIEDINNMVLFTGSRAMALKPLQASILDQSLEPLRCFFAADGKGISRSFLEQSTAELQRVLQMYSVPTDTLIQLHGVLQSTDDGTEAAGDSNTSSNPSSPAPSPSASPSKPKKKRKFFSWGRKRGDSNDEKSKEDAATLGSQKLASIWSFMAQHVEHRAEGYVDAAIPLSSDHCIAVLATRTNDKHARKFVAEKSAQAHPTASSEKRNK